MPVPLARAHPPTIPYNCGGRLAHGGPRRVLDYLPHVTLTAVLEIVILLVFIPWVLFTKKDPTAAVAWCLVVILMPVFGALLFWVFGYAHVTRPLRRKRRHRATFRER